MALKKSDLYSSLWKGADELRGGMDASQYKDYVLTLLFVKYVTDKAKSDKNSLIDVPTGGSFDDLVRFKGDKEIGDKINKAISKLAEANDLQKVIDLADFNDEEKLGKGKEMQDRLTNLIAIFQDLDFRGSRAEGDDLLGDAYEYLMRHFATESGKSKGQFYTPAEVSRVMAQLIGIKPNTPYSATVYDPTCGSGSLLLKVADAAPRGLTIYGQEKDNATWALAKMNMILHGNEIADIRKGDTIASPQFTTDDRLDTFDFLVANPPFSVKSWANGLDNEYGRFDGYGRPPEKNGDFAFLLHMLKSLKSTGKGAVILPHGVLFRGNAEATIRKEIVKRGFIKGIIGLPANLFYGTGIPACILVLDKENAHARTGIFMVDASKGFEKDGPKNRLRPRDMHKITDAFTKQAEIVGYSRMVPLSEIENAANDFNLNIPRYIDSSEPEDIQDLHAHIHGGIPNRDIDALGTYWTAFPSLRFEIFRPLREGYSELAVDKNDIHATIANSVEYQAFNSTIGKLVSEWWDGHREQLAEISGTTRPAELISVLSENLLDVFHPRPLVDEYAVYEQLMSYWNQTMHDDVALIMSEGWDGAAKPRTTIEDKDRKLSEIPDLIIGTGRTASKYKMDLVPPALIVARYLIDERSKLDKLNAEVESAAEAIEEFVEDNSGEDGPLIDALDDGKISKTLAGARLREAKREDPRSDEVAALSMLIALYEAETAAKKSASEWEAKLDRATLAQYGKLSTVDIQQLVLDDKWGRTVARGVGKELSALIHQLVDRLGALGTRYEIPLAHLDYRLQQLRQEVTEKLADMDVLGLLSGEVRLPGFGDDWPEVSLGDHVTYVKTVALSRAQLDTESPIRYLHYGDIHTSTRIYLDAASQSMPRASASRIKTAGFLQVGDLIFADASEDPAGVGRSIEIVSVPPEGVVPGLHTIAARFDKSVLIDGYKAYLQFIPEFRAALLRLAAGTKVLATTRTYISSVTLRLPSVPEQEAIVLALKSASHEIELTSLRLEKAKAIEVGMRQELLVGRTRLPMKEPVA